jgi:DNA polymerase
LALGRIAAQRLLQTNTSLARLRGQVHTLETTQSPVIVTYHPAYLLRSPTEKRKAWQDLQFAQRFVAEATATGSGS